MAGEVKLPRLSQGMESGVIVRWLKQEGEPVEKGEPLYELDTDKVTQEVESPLSGVLLKIALPEGEAPVGTAIAYIGEPGEPAPEITPATARALTPEPGQIAETVVAAPELNPEPPSPGEGRTKASPLARRLARERGLTLAGMTGTGPEGRIVAEDIEQAASAAATGSTVSPAYAPPRSTEPGAVERVPLTSLRRTIVRRLGEAWQAPAFQISVSVDMTEVLAMHDRLRERLRPGERHISIADFLTKACAEALAQFLGVNALWLGDAIEMHHSVDIGIATATERGLIVPVIRGCEQRTLAELAAARADLVARTLAGTVALEDLEGGTFTISNLGTLGVEQFVAVLNAPQVAILAVGAVVERAVVRAGAVAIAPLMTLTLTCDHRAVDGSVAARFLGTVKGFLEEPGLML
ncbi:MAG: dihydrolipoamide acetyltransferase family protein [Gaiellaceae bacterium]|jgi:pyruvate dehydrogenase E2 component (dihydrolipoamide acetyltransferase)